MSNIATIEIFQALAMRILRLEEELRTNKEMFAAQSEDFKDLEYQNNKTIQCQHATISTLRDIVKAQETKLKQLPQVATA